MGEGNVIRLQDERGFGESVAAIMRAAEKRLAELDRRRRQTVPASELVVGLQCGGSDAFSGVTCNPAVGYAADLLVRAGATVMFSEVTEVRDAIHLLTPRAATEDVARDLIREMRWYDEYLARGAADRSANTTPGNKRGGLANIVEKALGSVAKAGSTAIRAVATHGEKVTAKGLVFAATPASDFICGTQQLASMNLHVFTTGEGSPVRAGAGAGDQSVLAHRAGGEVGGPDRSGRRPHCHRPRHHRGSRLGTLPLDSRCGQRAPQDVGGTLGLGQRACPFQSGPVLEPGPNRLCLQRREAQRKRREKSKNKAAGEGEVRGRVPMALLEQKRNIQLCCHSLGFPRARTPGCPPVNGVNEERADRHISSLQFPHPPLKSPPLLDERSLPSTALSSK